MSHSKGVLRQAVLSFLSRQVHKYFYIIGNISFLTQQILGSELT